MINSSNLSCSNLAHGLKGSGLNVYWINDNPIHQKRLMQELTIKTFTSGRPVVRTFQREIGLDRYLLPITLLNNNNKVGESLFFELRGFILIARKLLKSSDKSLVF